LPTMIAALIAPIEIPATQSGKYSGRQRFVNSGLIAAKSPAALQDQANFLVIRQRTSWMASWSICCNGCRCDEILAGYGQH